MVVRLSGLAGKPARTSASPYLCTTFVPSGFVCPVGRSRESNSYEVHLGVPEEKYGTEMPDIRPRSSNFISRTTSCPSSLSQLLNLRRRPRESNSAKYFAPPVSVMTRDI